MDQIERIFGSVTWTNSVDQYRLLYAPAEDGCLVSIWDAWNRFVRSLMLTCASGPVQGLSGTTHVPSTVRGETAAISHITSSHRGTFIRVIRGEPQWASAKAVPDFV